MKQAGAPVRTVGAVTTTAVSQLLVAYTIQVDNAFESIMIERPHRWLVSLPMWANFLRYIPPEGIPVAALHPDLVTLPGLQRWRYVDVTPDGIVTPTRGGRRAQVVWSRVVERGGRELVVARPG